RNCPAGDRLLQLHPRGLQPDPDPAARRLERRVRIASSAAEIHMADIPAIRSDAAAPAFLLRLADPHDDRLPARALSRAPLRGAELLACFTECSRPRDTSARPGRMTVMRTRPRASCGSLVRTKSSSSPASCTTPQNPRGRFSGIASPACYLG